MYKKEYIVSSLTRTCTLIALILDGLSFVYLTLFAIYFKSFINFLMRFDDINININNDFLLFDNYFGLIQGILIFASVISGIFLIINLILFTKLINSKVSVNTARNITIYQIIFGALSLLGNIISGILYLISGINSHSNLKPIDNLNIGNY